MSDKIIKAAKAVGLILDEDQMKKINALSIKELKAEDVYAFRVVMCDNEVDRDYEVFPKTSLDKMSEMFKGKTVISDHRHLSGNQIARIYETEVQTSSNISSTGESFSQLIAYCYMLRTDTNKDLILEIDAGIKKEVSVGCAIKSVICSICGTDNRKTWCDHYGGKEYEGKKCHFRLENASDAYELSFVAVPAQPNAGVTKEYGAEKKEEKLKPEEKDFVNLHMQMMKSFIFIENEKENDNE